MGKRRFQLLLIVALSIAAGFFLGSYNSGDSPRTAVYKLFGTSPLVGQASLALQEDRQAEALEILDASISRKCDMGGRARQKLAAVVGQKAGELMGGRPDDAFALLQRAVLLSPNDPDLLNRAGNAARRTGQTDVALDFYKRALGHKYGNSQTWYNMGLVHHRLGRLAKAQTDFENAMAGNPSFINDIRYNLALVVEELGDPEKALELGRTILKDNPGHALARELVTRLQSAP